MLTRMHSAVVAHPYHQLADRAAAGQLSSQSQQLLSQLAQHTLVSVCTEYKMCACSVYMDIWKQAYSIASLLLSSTLLLPAGLSRPISHH